MMHIDRLYLAPAYIMVLSYFLAAVLGVIDIFCCRSGKSMQTLMKIAVSYYKEKLLMLCKFEACFYFFRSLQ